MNDELFLWYGWPTKDVQPYFHRGLLSEILTIANLRHVASRIWTCAEPEFRLSWIKLCGSNSHYTTAPQWVNNVKLLNNVYDKHFSSQNLNEKSMIDILLYGCDDFNEHDSKEILLYTIDCFNLLNVLKDHWLISAYSKYILLLFLSSTFINLSCFLVTTF